MNNTTFIEKDVICRKMHHGIYIDIMCLNNTSRNIINRYIQYISARILNIVALQKKGYITDNKIKKLVIHIFSYIFNKNIQKFLLFIVKRLNNKKTDLVGHFFGRAPFKKTSFPKDYLGKPKYIKFENLYLPVLQEVEKYLEIRYGKNYMDLPSKEEKAKYPSHAFIIDTENDYRKYWNSETQCYEQRKQ